jgi:AcrR family transcriptional regulator
VAIQAPARSTRDRILDIALDLFTEKGYENTSLRDIADAMGFTKAAIYYHFRSKEDIFMALHMRLHAAFGLHLEALTAEGGISTESWADVLDRSADLLVENRKLLAMHERNRAAFDSLHRKDHAEEHEELNDRLLAVVTDPSVPVRDRVRIACAMGALMTSVLLLGKSDGEQDDELVTEIRGVVSDILRSPAPQGTPSRPRRRV